MVCLALWLFGGFGFFCALLGFWGCDTPDNRAYREYKSITRELHNVGFRVDRNCADCAFWGYRWDGKNGASFASGSSTTHGSERSLPRSTRIVQLLRFD